jgi:hypothetical protein
MLLAQGGSADSRASFAPALRPDATAALLELPSAAATARLVWTGDRVAQLNEVEWEPTKAAARGSGPNPHTPPENYWHKEEQHAAICQ